MDRAAANQPRFTRGRFVACVPDVNHQKKRGLNHEANFNEANFDEANYDTIDTTATRRRVRRRPVARGCRLRQRRRCEQQRFDGGFERGRPGRLDRGHDRGLGRSR